MSSKRSEDQPSQPDNNAELDRDTPVDRTHYYGENRNRQEVDKGDLDEETLDSDAPYNKTYGREKPESTD